MRRLQDVVGITIAEEDKKALNSLAKNRNALQHWGLTESAPAIEARAAAVLEFLIRFLQEHLMGELDGDQFADMSQVLEGLAGINAYIQRRMDNLNKTTLSAVLERTVQCPECAQFALVVDGTENKCHFCLRSSWDTEELAERYASEILEYWRHPSYEGGTDPQHECPDCETETLVLGVVIAAQPEQQVDFCFNCAETFDSLESCMRCGRLYVFHDGDAVICGHCLSDLVESG